MLKYNVSGAHPGSEKPAGDYPFRVHKNNGKMALAVQAYTFSKYLGHLVVSFDSNNEPIAWTGNPILLDNSVPKGRSSQNSINSKLTLNLASGLLSRK